MCIRDRVIVVDGKSSNTTSFADTFLAGNYRNLLRKADIVDDLCVGSNCVVCRYIDYITLGGCCCSYGREIVGIRECIIGAGISQFLKSSLNGIYLIL